MVTEAPTRIELAIENPTNVKVTSEKATGKGGTKRCGYSLLLYLMSARNFSPIVYSICSSAQSLSILRPPPVSFAPPNMSLPKLITWMVPTVAIKVGREPPEQTLLSTKKRRKPPSRFVPASGALAGGDRICPSYWPDAAVLARSQGLLSCTFPSFQWSAGLV